VPPDVIDTRELDAVQVLDHLIARAVKTGASDVHLEPKRKNLVVRFRIDGVMTYQGTLPLDLAPSLNTRVKVLGRMDMTIRRLPQDGQFTLELADGQLAHLRCSTYPSIHGETVVMRVLLSRHLIPIDQLGMSAEQLGTIGEITSQNTGLVLVCGPTGSGKTSTLYSLMQQLDTANLNVVTLEDPIEVEFHDVTQGQINPRGGLTFASGLRAILRQDPDVIMVGEMRDPETAQIALQASLTGHMVLSTLHTSDVVETVARVVDLGVEPWIVGNALQAIIAQRLVRTLCAVCAETYTLEEDVVQGTDGDTVLLEKGTELKRAKGCDKCHETGYRGRAGLFEVLRLDDDLRDLVRSRASTRTFREYLDEKGGRNLRLVGMQRVKEGVTSLREVLRVT
jgi:general secretion pathway protein E/type IV pilus assembly protein PilB